MIVCMEEELLRAHQRATKDHTPLSACSFLLESMFFHTTNGGGVANGCGMGGAPPSGMTRYAASMVVFKVLQWNLHTLGSATLSSVERLSFSRRLIMYYCYGKGDQRSIPCREVVPLSEVPLYCS